MEGRFDERKAQGKRNSIVLGALDVELKVKTQNKSLSLVINFFLGRSAELNKTLAHCPRPTPSKVAPGGRAG
jgi:hypothetical protein